MLLSFRAGVINDFVYCNRWSDIKSLIGHKRLFVVEKAHSQRTMQFHFTDPEVAKYVRKMCILQSNFCKQHLQNESEHRNQNLSVSATDVTVSSLLALLSLYVGTILIGDLYVIFRTPQVTWDYG